VLLSTFIVIFCLFGAVPSFGSPQIQGDFYSETVYDSRIDGAVTDSRFYNYWDLLSNRVRPYAGAHLTRDLTNSRAPEAIENAFMPTAGLSVTVLRAPYVAVFSEYRWIYRSNTRPTQSQRGQDLRFGGIFYFKEYLKYGLFTESYGESIQIDRVSPDPVLATWLKFGREFSIARNFKVAPYLEVFTRQTPDLGYGPTENEFRAGTRLQFSVWETHGQLLLTYAAASNVTPGGWDAMFVLSKRAF